MKHNLRKNVPLKGCRNHPRRPQRRKHFLPDNFNYRATAPLASVFFEPSLADEADLRLVFFFVSER